MTRYRTFTGDDAVAAAEAALARAAGCPVTIERAGDLGGDERRNLVLRASAIAPDGAARPIIIKATRAAGYDPAAPDAFATSGLVKEWAAATLLARRRATLAHRAALLAGDTAQGVLVFEDLGADLPSLVQPLLHGSAAEAEAALLAYATSLARLHAHTIGCQGEHAAVVRTAYPGARVPPPGEDWIERTARKAASLMEGSLPEEEVALIALRLQAPGPWLALVHRDPCPDNVLLTPDGSARLIDFEFASPGHALIDAAYWRMGFPTCWCAGRVPEAIGRRIDRAYRDVLGEAVPLAGDDEVFRRESALIAVAWLLGSLAWLLEGALQEEGSWGISTRRNRILHYLETAIEAAADADILPGIRDAAADWRDRLRARWPSSAPLAPYPAFAGP